MRTEIWPGNSYPLGATWDGEGVNFALFSENAKRVELCLFESKSPEKKVERIEVVEKTDMVWHVYLPNAKPGLLYGYRVYGSYDPKNGNKFNSSKLLLDPYAKAISGTINWDDSLFENSKDSAHAIPKCVVVNDYFDWKGVSSPKIPWHKTLIYELHVKGFTALNPHVPKTKRGTYSGLACPAVIKYLKSLGVTALELMPVHQFTADKHLVDKGLTNYWGYNSIGYFAPDSRYSSSGTGGEQVAEFKSMVKTLHSEGIEVILDVVYNHTGEGNHEGPTISFRGIDNSSYYRLNVNDKNLYIDYTGCGNTLNMTHPRVLQLIMDSLRYWVNEMHVDGFRFDLASTLARELHSVDKLGAFFDIIHQDPVLSRVKLIAEPWDLGEGGYQVGNFPVLWAEWNGKYRDNIKRYWKGDSEQVAELAYRLTGSSDLYEETGKRPYASINFITCHDGFTLHDLVTYEKKLNEANMENNKDGNDNNLNWNCGVEGETKNQKINELRAKQKRNMMATLLLSQGVPMLLAGDERGRSQLGNNNPYCQDNKISWINWDELALDNEFFRFTKYLIKIRKNHSVLRRRKFFKGQVIRNSNVKDIVWLRPDGKEMTEGDWNNGHSKCIGLLINGDLIEQFDEKGNKIDDDKLLLLLNSYYEPITFTLPSFRSQSKWETLIETKNIDGLSFKEPIAGRQQYYLEERSLSLFRMIGEGFE